MLIMPYSTALNLARPPYVCYGAAILCLVVYTLQFNPAITEVMLYYPDSWNPLKMVTATLAHADFWHLFGNLVFFMAFAPALEILVGSRLRFVGIMLFIALVTGICYSLSIVIGNSAPVPTLGFSGVVMGMIGLSAHLMPHARVRVFFWIFVFWKTFFVPAWILAVIFIGMDAWTMLTADYYGGINLVAHVAGGLAGYLYGLFWLDERKQDTSDELAAEIEAQRVEQRYGKTRAEAHRYKTRTDPLLAERERQREHDRFMGHVYRLVKAHRDSDAVLELLTHYDQQTLYTELEPIFERALEWGPSRTLLCLGRLLIQILDQEQRHGRALMVIEQCQAVSPKFALPDLGRLLFFAQMAYDTDRLEIARNLLSDAAERYGSAVNSRQCNHLLQKCR